MAKRGDAQTKAIATIRGMDARLRRIEQHCEACQRRKKKRPIGMVPPGEDTDVRGELLEQDEDAPEGSEVVRR